MELPLNDERREPRKGSKAWVASEMARYRELSRKHDGLTTAWYAKTALGVSRQRVHQMMNCGQLPTYVILGKRFIACDVLEVFARIERLPGRPIVELVVA
jgi:predicted DNA-binding transcriptional regulator AlpA